MRDSAFDPMAKSRRVNKDLFGARDDSPSPLTQPAGIDPMRKLGRELG